MPYNHELANPLGFEDISRDGWLQERLKTFNFGFGPESPKASVLDELEVKHKHELPMKSTYGELTTSVAIDGSLTVLEDNTAAAIKFATVRKNMGLEKRQTGIVDPAVLRKPFKVTRDLALLPGFGVTDMASGGSWDEKFRIELYETLKHMRVSGTLEPRSLMQNLALLLQSHVASHALSCPNCTRGRTSFDADFTKWECELCGRPVHESDFLLPKSFFGNSSEHFTSIMVTIERLLLQAIVQNAAVGNTPSTSTENVIFIADGMLQTFRLPFLSSLMLKSYQSMDPFPNVASFVKSGRLIAITEMFGVEDLILPGMVAMVTDKARGIMGGNPRGGGVFGKAFIYRTERGDKWFVFNTIPRQGEAHSLDGDSPLADAWDNYPHLATIGEFIEHAQTDEYGPEQASLDVIAEANNEASLPAVLSRRTLEALVREQMAQGQ